MLILLCLPLNVSLIISEPGFPRIISEDGVVTALSRRQAVTRSVGVTVETFSSTSLTLNCLARGSPAPVISWSKEGQPLVSRERIFVDNDGSLIIRKTRIEDTGQYQCSARNLIGEISEVSFVYIAGKLSPVSLLVIYFNHLSFWIDSFVGGSYFKISLVYSTSTSKDQEIQVLYHLVRKAAI